LIAVHKSRYSLSMTGLKTHGGKRKGAGRKPGSRKYGEETKPVRVPVSMVSLLTDYIKVRQAQRYDSEVGDYLLPTTHAPSREYPLFSSVAAGFPSPAADYQEGTLDLNQEFVKSPSSTFFVRVTGESMTGEGIFPGSLLIVDRSLTARHDSVVIALVDTELTVKKLYKRGGVIELHAANPRYNPISFCEGTELEIWGVVTGAIRRFS
jgi:DNA polymerase V